jgi:hypothetical protein
MQLLRFLFLLLLCGAFTCCTKQSGDESAKTAGSQAPAAVDPQQAENLLEAAEADLTQLIIMYTGDTMSAVQPPKGFDPPQGGIPALANAVAEYQRSIVYFNQLRVSEAGGDPSKIRADRAGGMLGEHPCLLLDYGGWERPNDDAGAHYVELYLTYLGDFGYAAAGSTLFARLAPERWEAYREVNPGVDLLVSAGTAQGEPLPSTPAVTREVFGGLWCIVAVPLPRIADGDPFELIAQFVEEAWGQVEAAGADYSILMLAEGPGPLYRDLEADGRFTVIIGAPDRLAVKAGFGKLEPGASLLLPELNPSGRQLGVCHLQYDGDTPAGYHLLLTDCLEDASQAYPYRSQAAAAALAHAGLAGE